MNSAEGTVVKIFGLYYTVEYQKQNINCVLRGKIRKDKDLKRFSNPVAVGDRVKIEINNDRNGVINEICKRKNMFSRKEKGRNRKEDIIASNLDLIVIVQSFREPKINLRFVDRLIVRGEKEGIKVLLCVNKKDLSDEKTIQYINDYYENANIDILMISALTGESIENFRTYLENNISLLIGFSGVGKSSILNRICPGLNLKTAEISKRTKKGRHTTSNVEMVRLTDESCIIDTPGVREFGLMDIEPHMLGFCFNEFKKYYEKCGFNPCTHDHEPGCEIKRQVELGGIFNDRYISYLNILYSLKEYYDGQYG